MLPLSGASVKSEEISRTLCVPDDVLTSRVSVRMSSFHPRDRLEVAEEVPLAFDALSSVSNS